MKIEKVAVSKITPYKNNAKIHTREQIEQIKRSIQEFGNNDPIAIDEAGVIIEGHGRFIALQELGYKTVDCIRLTHMSEEQKRAYILIHNKLTMNTGFDIQLLEDELKSIRSIDMGSFDFDCDFSIDGDMSFNFEEEEGEAIPEPPAEPKSRPGQIYQLGRHRLMCGDSTKAEDVDKLTEGEGMDLCVTDPPYNVGYGDMCADNVGRQNSNRPQDHILNDSMEEPRFYEFLLDFYKQMLRTLRPGAPFYIFHADTEGLRFRAALNEAGGQIRQCLIWVKNVMVMGRQDYQWKHEPILYGWNEGAGHYFVDDRCQTTVFETKPDIENMDEAELRKTARFLLDRLESISSTIIREKKPHRSDLHPTMKPIPLCAKLIQNSSRKGDKVVDFFGGSGTILMACEETGRTAYLMEMDPRFVDVIIQRWEEATGGKAVLINGDR